MTVSTWGGLGNSNAFLKPTALETPPGGIGSLDRPRVSPRRPEVA
ncbi:MAG: hypothetical protein VYA69_05005 [Gemmatimonadota bacterium]|nr:hypothetical protein [Gemmatimonadota bacterium]